MIGPNADGDVLPAAEVTEANTRPSPGIPPGQWPARTIPVHLTSAEISSDLGSIC